MSNDPVDNIGHTPVFINVDTGEVVDTLAELTRQFQGSTTKHVLTNVRYTLCGMSAGPVDLAEVAGILEKHAP